MRKVFFGKKKKEFYKDLLIKADLELHEQIAKKILSEVPSGGTILDMGCGEGALSERLSDLGYVVVAADQDADSFKSTKATFSRLNFDSAHEITEFALQHKGKFDAVLGVEVIEHVQDQWQYTRQLMSLAKKGGLILITTPNTSSWLSRLIFLFSGRFHQFSDEDLSYGHISPISAWELELILKYSDASQIEISSAGILPPIYITGFNKLSFFSILSLPLRLVMKGIIDGWCIMATARKL
jgi:cyclopropane fatty-acyl-phospholipid synthase-like methyltransferase